MNKNVIKFAKKYHAALSISLTTLCCAAAYYGAFLLRFDFHYDRIPAPHLKALWLGLPAAVLAKMAALVLFRVNRGLYRYVGMHDFVQLLKAVTLGSLAFASGWMLALNRAVYMPRSIYLLDWMLCLALLTGLRVAVRLWRSSRDRKAKAESGPGVRRALVVGAGNLGESILRIIDRRFLGHDYDLVGFVDSDPDKQDSAIHGIPVLGVPENAAELVRSLGIHTLVFAISNPPPGLFQQVVEACDGLNVEFNVVSVLKDMKSGAVSVDRMRGLKIEDLLGRNPVWLDDGPVRNAVAGKTVLVTGAGGSIGSELCRQLATMQPARLVLFESGETPLFEIDRELRHRFPEVDIRPFIGDIKHENVIERAFASHKPDFVYHAAAYKHVPLMEAHPDEAVLNNVRGTRLLAEAARRHGCERFVMISTDKAVRPTNVMGATKRMCELVIQSMNGGDTVFIAVRFGNVLGSNGSVIPIFQKQIEAGGPLTITHPEMTRFFMTIPEAVSLVLQCGAIAEPRDIFVLDMGTPVKIIDLARNMLRLSGLREGVDIKLEVTGLRPGEKMYEELVAYGEELVPTPVQKVNVLKLTCDNLAVEVLMAMVHRLEEVALARRVEKVRELLWRLIDMDGGRSQGGGCGLLGVGADELAKEWIDTVALAPAVHGLPIKGRILAVVGDPSINPPVEGVLRAAGYQPDCVGSIDAAVALLVPGHAYAAILCDYIMPSGTVFQLRDRIQLGGLRIRIVAMSKYDSTILTEVLDFDPHIPVLRKPFSSAEFEKVLHGLSE